MPLRPCRLPGDRTQRFPSADCTVGALGSGAQLLGAARAHQARRQHPSPGALEPGRPTRSTHTGPAVRQCCGSAAGLPRVCCGVGCGAPSMAVPRTVVALAGCAAPPTAGRGAPRPVPRRAPRRLQHLSLLRTTSHRIAAHHTAPGPPRRRAAVVDVGVVRQGPGGTRAGCGRRAGTGPGPLNRRMRLGDHQ